MHMPPYSRYRTVAPTPAKPPRPAGQMVGPGIFSSINPAIAATCALPVNALQGKTKAGMTYMDPYFASQDDRKRWMDANSVCPTPPAFVPSVAARPAGPGAFGGGSGDACALPANALVGTLLDGATSNDPYFASQDDRKRWMLANPSCPTPPAFVPGTPYTGAPPGGPPAVAVPWGWIGVGAAVLAAAGVALYAASQAGAPAPRASRGTRRSSARSNPSRRGRRKHGRRHHRRAGR